ncbi:MAG: T9SS type A sorting domain-containing protein [Bacteroidetes bacterium]|nr:T9SS type A sorting domain-containing protein [Bacteroidota bacterium]
MKRINHVFFQFLFVLISCAIADIKNASAAQFSKATAYQTSGALVNNAKNQSILYLKLEATATSTGKWGMTSIAFTMANTNNADVSKAKLYYNTSNSLTGAIRLDSISNPNGNITFNFNLSNLGINPRYLILVYDISANSPCGTDVLDAFVVPNSLVINGLGAGNYTPIDNNPIGNRTLTGSSMAIPAISITANSTSICAGATVFFTTSVSNGGTAPAYKWYINNVLQNGSLGAFSYSAFSNGDVVSCVLTSNLACASPAVVSSNNITIAVSNVSATPSVSISSNLSAICPGTNVTFTPSPVNGGSAPTYKWYLNNVLKSTNNGNYSVSNLANGDVVYCTMSSNLTCVSQSTVSSNNIATTVYPSSVAPTISIAASSTSICQGSMVTFTPTSTYMGPSGFYKWYVNNTLKTTNSTIYTTTALNNNDIVKCVMTSSLSCASLTTKTSNSISMSVGGTVQTPSLSISASSISFCYGTPVTFTPSSTNGGSAPTYKWYINSILTASNSGTFTSTTLNNNDVISCIMIPSSTCVSQTSVSSNLISVAVTGTLVTPTLSINASKTSICQGEAVTFTPIATNQGSSPTYKWFVNNVLAATNTGTFTTSTLFNGDSITCSLTSSLACVASISVVSNSISIAVNGALATPTIAISASATSICQGTNVTFTPVFTNGGSAPTFKWYINGSYKTTTTGNYSSTTLNNNDEVTCKLISNLNCVTTPTVESDGVSINVGPANHIATLSGITTVMSGNTAMFTASSNNGGTNPKYQWFKNGVMVGNNTSTYVNEVLANGDNIYCRITSSNTCTMPQITNSNTVVVSIVPAARKRELCILDLSIQNKEYSKANLYSLKYMLEVAGIPYVVTTSCVEAQNYKMIVGTSTVEGGVLVSDERTIIKNYIKSGGVVVFSRLKESDFYTSFGISGYLSKTTRHTLTWNTAGGDPCLKWFDDSLEKTISLGNLQLANVIDSRSFTLNGASALAHYDDGSVALTKNAYGTGFAYAFGISYKEMILRNQLNKDFEAQRDYTNAFEPSTDVLSFLIRGIYTNHIPKGVWKHTSPKNSKSTLIMTHDIDAATSMALMNTFADYEKNMGIRSTYFITAHYTHDLNVSNFYDPYIAEMSALISKGHRIASHSVGHFNDMSDSNVVLLGAPGNTKTSYQPSNMGGSTVGATLYGELEVSKDLLNTDIGASVRTFRPGFLLIHPKQTETLGNLGYEYSSSNTACDVLSNFPFLLHEYQDFDAPLTNILEIPLTNSDVVRDYTLDSLNYPTLVTAWKNVYYKNHANNAPTTVLIHPTKNFKFLAEQSFINQLPTGIVYKSIEGFGDYWRNRAEVSYTTSLSGSNLTITISNSSLPLDNDFSLIVDNGQSLSSIVVQDESGNVLTFDRGNWDNNGKVLYNKNASVNYRETSTPLGNENTTDAFNSSAQPNPFSGITEILFQLNQDSQVNLELFNFMGERVATLLNKELSAGSHQEIFDGSNLADGIYFYRLSANGKTVLKKIVLAH